MTWLDYVARCRQHDPKQYSPLYVSGRLAGRVSHHLEDHLASLAGGLVHRREKAWWVGGRGQAEVASSFQTVARRLAESRLIPPLTGERYPILDLAVGSLLGTIDRSAATWFGFRTRGVHLNAFTRLIDGAPMVWLARRAFTHPRFPGKLDNLVAGGVAAATSVRAALSREAKEEAGIDLSMLGTALPVSRLAYCAETPEGLVDVEMAVFDLEVGASFQPKNQDATVEHFLLASPREAERLALDEDAFKVNCGLVLFDFLARHQWTEAASTLRCLPGGAQK